MNCDVDEATEGLENEFWRRWSDGKVGECRCWEHLRDWTEAKPREGKNAGRVVGSGIALLVVARNEYCPSSIIYILSLKGLS